jgi:hypothetical protein
VRETSPDSADGVGDSGGEEKAERGGLSKRWASRLRCTRVVLAHPRIDALQVPRRSLSRSKRRQAPRTTPGTREEREEVGRGCNNGAT